MKKALKISVVAIFAVFVLIQFVRPERTNPPVKPEQTLESSMRVPEDVRKILKRSCYDCHSNETVYPWYSNIAPISWELVEHIRVGRGELNFSEWNTYDAQKKERKLDEICDEIESGEMPHYQYLWIHRDAKLSAADIKALCGWTKDYAREFEENAVP